MEVDHFDPRQKNDYIQKYKNLLLATRHCNGAKGQKWPSKNDLKLGIRFLNPRIEQDYGVHIFEDPITHKLIGVTPAGIYHIRHCDLNAEYLVTERKDRAEVLKLFRSKSIKMKKGPYEAAAEVIDALRIQLDLMIPEFPYIN